jgi:nitrogen fixation protein FixH
MNSQFTGRHMTAILVAFFGVVIVVNVVMARYATSTFGGIVVENSYVASQEFNKWLDEAATEKALGWTAKLERVEGDRLSVRLAGAPAGTILSAVARHPLGHAPDRGLTFSSDGQGHYLSREELPKGRWIVRVAARSGKAVWRTEENVW